jgi:5'-nucleotidase (lipoprotein e(P4) family)
MIKIFNSSFISIWKWVAFWMIFLGTAFQLYGDKAKVPNDIRWIRQSLEYERLCEQVYQRSTVQILKVLKKESKKKNLALVVDLDETVLNNSLYQVERWQAGLTFTQDSWSDWVNRKEAGLVPGAKAFLSTVRKKGVRVVFLSNRMNDNLKPTRENLQALGALDPRDLFLLRLDKDDLKEVRRKEVTDGTGRMKKVGPLKVIGYVGDQMGDFPSDRKQEFGKTNFLLPNPMYGKW